MLQMSKLRIAVTALCLVATIGSAFACAVTSGGASFLVYQSDTGAWNINLGVSYFEEPKSLKVTVESKDSTGTFSVVYFLTVNGPKGLRNDDLSLYWVDTDGAVLHNWKRWHPNVLRHGYIKLEQLSNRFSGLDTRTT